MANEANLTTLSAILKDIFLGPIREQMIKMGILFFRLTKTSDFIDAGGTKTIFPVQLGFSQAVGARNERETLPVAKSQRYARAELDLKTNYGSIEVTGHVIRAARNDAGAFVRAVASEMSGMVDGLKKDINRQIFGSGNSVLGVVASVSAAEITLAVSNVSPGSLHFEETQDLQIFAPLSGNPDEGTERDSGFNVLTIVDGTKITVSPNPTGAVIAGDLIVRKAAANREMNGLRVIVDDAAGVFQNIDGALQRRWRGNVFPNPAAPGTLRAFTLKIVQEAYTAAEKNLQPSIIVSPFELRDKLVDRLVADKRFVSSLDLDGGFKAVEYNGKPWVSDDQAHNNLIYILNENQLAFHQIGDFDWLNEDGLILRKVSGVDSYEANLVYASQMITYRRNSHARLEDVTQTV